MDVEKNEVVIVLDRGKDLEEVADATYCCQGKPSSAAANATI
jgi:hypothetical protein